MRTMCFTLASLLCTAVSVLALDPETMIGDRPQGMTGYDKMTLERRGAQGTLYVNCDDTCTVAVDGRVVGSSSGMRTMEAEVTLRLGSVITARCRDTCKSDGLALVFVAKNGKASFAAAPEGWHVYAPLSGGDWMDLTRVAREDLRPCRKGTNNAWRLRIEKASGVPCPQSIWSKDLGTTVHVLHVVTYADLTKHAGK